MKSRLLFLALVATALVPAMAQQTTFPTETTEHNEQTALRTQLISNVQLFKLPPPYQENFSFLDRIKEVMASLQFGDGTIIAELKLLRKRITQLIFDSEYLKNTTLNQEWARQLRLIALRDLNHEDVKFSQRIHDFRALTRAGDGDLMTELRALRHRVNQVLFENELMRQVDLDSEELSPLRLNEFRHMDDREVGRRFSGSIDTFRELTTFGQEDLNSELKAFRLRLNEMLYENEVVRNADDEKSWMKVLRLKELRNIDERDVKFEERIRYFMGLTTFGNGDLTTELRAFRQRINEALLENEVVGNIDFSKGWLKNLRLYELGNIDDKNIRFTEQIDAFRDLATFGDGDITTELKGFTDKLNTFLKESALSKELRDPNGAFVQDSLKKLFNRHFNF